MEKPQIKINCDCGVAHEVNRDKNAPTTAISMGCNWCPSCEETADEDYDEWYNYTDPDDPYDKGDDPNQLMLFSITDEILKPNFELDGVHHKEFPV